MMDQKVAELLNQQINKEFYSAYLYLELSVYYEENDLDGFANWYMVQTQEERDHAMLMIQYLQKNSAPVTLDTVEKPEVKLGNVKDPLVVAAQHEKYVTGLINNIYDAAYQAKDFRTMQFLDWFVKEQAEEEKTADGLVKKYDLFGTDPKGLYLLDQELAARTYAAPTLTV
ncbi:MAG: ferritin [Peptococcaceae bacterium]|nr:ferritin [Peptococcaceae bacterium]